MRTYLILMIALAFFARVSMAQTPDEKGKQYEVALTWREWDVMKDWKKFPADQARIMPPLLYFWNGEYVGMDEAGRAKIYEGLKDLDNLKILVQSRSVDGSAPMRDGFLDAGIWAEFNALFRKKNFEVAIKYTIDKEDVLRLPWSNPFLPPPKPKQDK